MANRGQVTPLGPGVVDRGAYNYGGDPDAANRESGALAAEAEAAQRRQGEQINTGNADAARGQGQDARAAQLGMADMIARRASGQTPSIAGMVGARDMNRVAAEQSSAAASARGPAALALAQQGAAANTAAGQSNISNSTQINSANERMQAEQAATGAYANLRGGDLSQQGQDFSQSAAQAQMNAAQRAQNDSYSMGTRQQGIGIQGMQLQADMNRDAAEQAGHFNAAGLQEQKNAAHDASVMGYVNASIQGASAAGSAAAMLSDEQTKVPVTWGSGEASPMPPEPGARTWGTGPGTSAIDMQRMIAHQALDQQASRDATSRGAMAGGPQAFDMNPGKRWDAEDLGLLQAKQRNGLELSEKEENSMPSLQHRAGQSKADASKDKPDPKTAADAAKAKDDAGKAALGDKIKSGLSGIGNALAARPSGGTAFHYVPATQHQLSVPSAMTSDEAAKVAAAAPAAASGGADSGGLKSALGGLKGVGNALAQSAPGGSEFHYQPPERRDLNVTQSDERTKTRAESPADKKAREDAEDAETTRKFMGEAKGLSYEERSKAIDERNAQDKQLAAEEKRRAQAPDIARANASDERNQGRAEFLKGVPLVGKWAAGKAAELANQTDDQKAARGAANKADSTGYNEFRAKLDHGARGAGHALLGSTFDKALARADNAPTVVGYRPQLDLGQRQMQTFTRERSEADLDAEAAADVAEYDRTHPAATAMASDERTKRQVGHLGPEVDHHDMADAALSMRAVPYAYKPEFAGREGQRPGEVNIGPVAQEMQKSPVAATAVKQSSPNGLRSIDIPKFTKVLGGVAASQQEQLDEQQRQISFMAQRLRSRK